MADLQLSRTDLDNLARMLASTVEAFQQSTELSAEMGATVGHSRLQGKVEDFAGAWSIKRGKIEKRLVELYDCVAAIQETFDAVDKELSSQLQKAASSARAVTNSPPTNLTPAMSGGAN